MNALLKEYLLANQSLPLAGIGVIYSQRESAHFAVGERQFLPPRIVHTFRNEPVDAIGDMVDWLSARMGLEPADVITRYKQFCQELSQSLSTETSVTWKGWGHWQKDEHGVLQFFTEQTVVQDQPVQATKIIRENSTHSLRVGEESRSSVEMAERLQQKKSQFSYEKLITWSWLLLAIGWFGWLVYVRSFNSDSFANPAVIKSVNAPKSYQEF